MVNLSLELYSSKGYLIVVGRIDLDRGSLGWHGTSVQAMYDVIPSSHSA